MMRSTIFSAVALAILGLSLFASEASAQTIYVEEYPTVVTPDEGYVVRQTVVAPAPIVRDRCGQASSLPASAGVPAAALRVC
jgi:hypothetical protein